MKTHIPFRIIQKFHTSYRGTKRKGGGVGVVVSI